MESMYINSRYNYKTRFSPADLHNGLINVYTGDDGKVMKTRVNAGRTDGIDLVPFSVHRFDTLIVSEMSDLCLTLHLSRKMKAAVFSVVQRLEVEIAIEYFKFQSINLI